MIRQQQCPADEQRQAIQAEGPDEEAGQGLEQLAPGSRQPQQMQQQGSGPAAEKRNKSVCKADKGGIVH